MIGANILESLGLCDGERTPPAVTPTRASKKSNLGSIQEASTEINVEEENKQEYQQKNALIKKVAPSSPSFRYSSMTTLFDIVEEGEEEVKKRSTSHDGGINNELR